jgi:hypothetical protein
MYSKKVLLKDPKIKALYAQFLKKQKGSGRMMGAGPWEDFTDFLKNSKILSAVGDVVLPTLGALGGTFLSANPLVGVAGAAAGQSVSDYIRSQGYGKFQGGCKCQMMRGGDSRLVTNLPGQKLGQRGGPHNAAYYSQPIGRVTRFKGAGGPMHNGSMGFVSSDVSKVTF